MRTNRDGGTEVGGQFISTAVRIGRDEFTVPIQHLQLGQKPFVPEQLPRDQECPRFAIIDEVSSIRISTFIGIGDWSVVRDLQVEQLVEIARGNTFACFRSIRGSPLAGLELIESRREGRKYLSSTIIGCRCGNRIT